MRDLNDDIDRSHTYKLNGYSLANLNLQRERVLGFELEACMEWIVASGFLRVLELMVVRVSPLMKKLLHLNQRVTLDQLSLFENSYW